MSAPAIKRVPLNRLNFAVLVLDQDGMCGCSIVPTVHPLYTGFPVCGAKLDAREGIIDEHLWPLAAGGSNDMDNRALLRKGCAKVKTGQYDKKLIAKVARQGGDAGQQKRRAEGKTATIQGGGFNKTLTRGFDGVVRERT
jgi:hypothetical protein